MEFLTLLIVLGFLQWWGSGGPLQHDDWYNRWETVITERIGASPVTLLITLAAPCLLIVLLQALFASIFFGVLSLLLYVGVLLFSLGRGDFTDSVQQYLSAWNEGDFAAAHEKARAIGDFHQTQPIDDHVSLHDHVRKAVVYEGFERWFAVVFWFLLLGPAACLAYRLCHLAAHQATARAQERQLALQIVHYLDWVPARLLALSFTLTGNFVNSFNRCWQMSQDNTATVQLLDDCATAAISGFYERDTCPTDQQHFIEYGRAELQAIQSLLSRSVVCWLIVIAVMQLI